MENNNQNSSQNFGGQGQFDPKKGQQYDPNKGKQQGREEEKNRDKNREDEKHGSNY